MRNKVEIRAFAIEQVVKMRCMSECPIEDVVKEAKLLENYIVGRAEIEEYHDMFEYMNKMMNAPNINYKTCSYTNDDDAAINYAN